MEGSFYTIHFANCCIDIPCRKSNNKKKKKELDRLTKLGVIKPVQEPTEWVSSMVAAEDGAVRLCIDPVHLNKALLRPHHPMKRVEQVIADMPGAKMFSILDAKCGIWQVPLSKES